MVVADGIDVVMVAVGVVVFDLMVSALRRAVKLLSRLLLMVVLLVVILMIRMISGGSEHMFLIREVEQVINPKELVHY